MKKYKEYVLDVNGFEVRATYSEENIEKIWKPLLQEIRKKHREKKRRVIVFLSAPPAVGKSTLAKFLEVLSKQDDGEAIQSIGLDGFHYSQDYIVTHSVTIDNKIVPMKDVKGCPETFDIESIKQKIYQMQNTDIKWPIYDRNLHDVVNDKILVSNQIVLIEGNWLLLRDEKWTDLRTYCDYAIQITCDEDTLKERLIERKIRGGLSMDEAEKFYENSDHKNVVRVLVNSQKGDYCLRLMKNLEFEKEE